jgi:hypothetical protein
MAGSAAPVPPFSVCGHATFEVGDLAGFQISDLRDRRWGVLRCEDASGEHWTALGDYGYCERLPRSKRRRLWRRRAVERVSLDAFRPEWVIRGWPDEWRSLARQGPLAALRWETTATDR